MKANPIYPSPLLAAPTTIRTYSRSKRVGPVVSAISPRACGPVFAWTCLWFAVYVIHASNQTESNLTQGFSHCATLACQAHRHLKDRTCTYHGNGPRATGNTSRPNLHSSLFVSTQINIATSGKRHSCRLSLRECWIWSRARPFVLRLRCW